MNGRISLSLAVVWLALCANAFAASVFVNCNTPNPNTFPSITAALNALNPAGPNLITVQGTCKENVFIGYYQNLTIQAAPSSTAVVENAANPTNIVMQAFGCRGLVLLNLVIRGGTVGLLVNQASETVIQNLVLEKNSSDGLVAQINSTLDVESSKFIHNGGNGLTVAPLCPMRPSQLNRARPSFSPEMPATALTSTRLICRSTSGRFGWKTTQELQCSPPMDNS